MERDSKYGVGKRVGNQVWLHHQYQEVFCPFGLRKALKIIERNIPNSVGHFKYDVVRYDEKNNTFCFILVDDFDENPEPVIYAWVTVNLNNNQIKGTICENNRPIYHHKWLMVTDDYNGFDLDEAKERSQKIQECNFNKNKMGRSEFWNEHCLPILEKR